MEIIIPIITGILAGVVINYISDVLPKFRKLTYPCCCYCKTKINWLDYISLKKCKHCGQKTSSRRIIIYLISPILYVLLWIYPLLGISFIFEAIILTYFIVVFVIDLENKLILNSTSVFGLVLMFFVGSATHGIKTTLIGGVSGYMIMYILFLFGVLFIKLLSKKNAKYNEEDVALGFGDVHLSGILGLLLGWPGITGGLFVAIILGGVISGGLVLIKTICKKYSHFEAIPYGPFLIIGSLILFYL